MKRRKCCYCNKQIEIKDGAFHHETTKKILCIQCASMAVASFLTGIAPFIHSHPSNKQTKGGGDANILPYHVP
jgi:hypothetical protein